MGKGWYPRLLLFRSVVVYVFLPFAEGKSTAYMGGAALRMENLSSRCITHIQQGYTVKWKPISEFSQAKRIT